MATHDYTIANQSAASARTDINNVLQAILTTNSSATAPTTTAAGMLWHDTASNALKIRNEGDDAWITVVNLNQTSDEVELLSNVLKAASASDILVKNSSDTTLVNLKIASQATAEAATNNTEIMSPLRVKHSMPVSLSTNGYQKLPSGLIINWGQIAVPANETATTSVTFATAFTTAVFNIQLTLEDATGTTFDNFGAYIVSKTTSGFVTRNASSSGSWSSSGTTLHFYAVGY